METLAINYLQFAAQINKPVHFTRTRYCNRTHHMHAIRLLSQKNLIEKVPGYVGQHWKITEKGQEVVANGWEFSALIA